MDNIEILYSVITLQSLFLAFGLGAALKVLGRIEDRIMKLE